MHPLLPFPSSTVPMPVRILSLATLLGLLPEPARKRPQPRAARRDDDALTVTIASTHVEVGPDGTVRFVSLATL